MPDNKRKRGKADRRSASRLQNYEVRYLADKFDVAMAYVHSVIKRVGNKRKAVEAALARKKVHRA